MNVIASNNVVACMKAGKVCKLFGIRLTTNTQIVQLAKNAGFDALFIEMEHSSLSLAETSNLCMAGLQTGITPLVRVPYQCGNGFVQRVLDGGAMGVIFPHIHNADDAKSVVSISKYPPMGTRSLTGQLPQFGLKSTPISKVVEESNLHGSMVVLMIETAGSVEKIEEIAAVKGVDVLLIGSNDLSIELGVPGQFDSNAFQNALKSVSAACKKHGKVLGFAGIYENRRLQDWGINELGARFVLGQQDSGLLARSGSEVVAALKDIHY